ncbi:MAG: amidoligase family protein [Pseudomonadota bacterium]
MEKTDDIPDLIPLPTPHTADGQSRRVGVEVEMGGLPAAQVAAGLAMACGGTVDEHSAHAFEVSGSRFGDVEVYLDTRFRKEAETWLHQGGLDLAQLVVPVEVVTPPIEPDLLGELDHAMQALADAGATGTADGLLLGFGVHLNVEIAGESADQIGAVLTSFALLEETLRDTLQIDATRRLLPFTARYPTAMIDRLVAERGAGMDALVQLYLDENPTRNSALDMLPVFAHLAPDAVAERITDDAVTARPTYHYRLPDCRLDESGWSITAEWNRWTVIERAARDPILSELCAAWLEHRAAWPEGRGQWAKTAADILRAHGLEFPA